MYNIYVFCCEKCNIQEEREIPISQYDELKNQQFCECGEKMIRIFTPIQGTLYKCGGFYDTSARGVKCR